MKKMDQLGEWLAHFFPCRQQERPLHLSLKFSHGLGDDFGFLTCDMFRIRKRNLDGLW